MVTLNNSKEVTLVPNQKVYSSTLAEIAGLWLGDEDNEHLLERDNVVPLVETENAKYFVLEDDKKFCAVFANVEGWTKENIEDHLIELMELTPEAQHSLLGSWPREGRYKEVTQEDIDNEPNFEWQEQLTKWYEDNCEYDGVLFEVEENRLIYVRNNCYSGPLLVVREAK